MKKMGKKTIVQVVDVICNICGKSCVDKLKNVEYCSMFADWGYSSKKDLQTHSCDLCEVCYDKVCGFIESLGGRIDIDSGDLCQNKITGKYISHL